jgi:hypothetical protein
VRKYALSLHSSQTLLSPVSDHGMTSTSDFRLIYLDDILGEEGFKGIEHKDGEQTDILKLLGSISEFDHIV